MKLHLKGGPPWHCQPSLRQAFGHDQPIEAQPASAHQTIDSDKDAGPVAGAGRQRRRDDDARLCTWRLPVLALNTPRLRQPIPAPRGRDLPATIDAAGAFDGYMRRASAIKANFRQRRRGGLRRRAWPGLRADSSSSRAPSPTPPWWALQDPLFVQAVQDAGTDPQAREAFAARLVDQPESVPRRRPRAGRPPGPRRCWDTWAPTLSWPARLSSRRSGDLGSARTGRRLPSKARTNTWRGSRPSRPSPCRSSSRPTSPPDRRLDGVPVLRGRGRGPRRKRRVWQ